MRSRVLALSMFVLAAGGCGGGGGSASSPSTPAPTTSTTASSGAAIVTIMGQKNDQSFNPNPAAIVQGGLVVWRNGDSTVHHIVMNDGSFDSGDLAPGATSKEMRLTSNG